MTTPLRYPVLLGLTTIAFNSSLAFAAENKANSSTPIIVTASRVAETEDETLASVSVITRTDIERSSARSAADLLKLQAGIDIAHTGGQHSSTNLFLRGTNANHTLFLIDGVRVSSATTGTFALEQLSLNQIERIEIVRGPRSTQYGSEAIGGIVNIITRTNAGYYARAGVGSFATKEASAGVRLGQDITLSLNADHIQTQGFSATNPNSSFYNPADNPYRKTNVNANLDVPLANNIKLGFKTWLSESRTSFDESPTTQGTTDSTQQVYSASLRQQVNENISQTFLFGHNQEVLDTKSGYPSEITTIRSMFDWQSDIALSDSTLLLFGVSHYQDKAKNIDTSFNTTVFDAKADNTAVFINLKYQLDKHDVMLSLREDDHSEFGSATTGLLSWGVNVSPQTRITASYSNAFRAPTLNELYHPGFFTFFAGNPDLQPETSTGGEISLRIKASEHNRVSITYFNNKIDNLISYEGANLQAINIASATTNGIELQHNWQHGDWSVNTDITLQTAVNDTTGEELLRRPRRKLNSVISHRYSDKVTSSVELILVSERKDGFGSSVTLPGYGLLNLSSRFQLDKDLWLDLRIDNLTNKQYEYASGYNTEDRSFFVGMNYDFKN